MTEQAIFKSSIGKYMESFHNARIKLGYKAEDSLYTFRTFDAFLCSQGFTGDYITRDIYVSYMESIRSMSPATRYLRASVLRRLCIYMSRLGVECYIPILPRRSWAQFSPHIFTRKEMEDIFKAADSLRAESRNCNASTICIPALLRLLYSTAMRISEALSIKNAYVDFDAHVITLNDTKNGSQRYAPVNATLEAVLKEYLRYRSRIPVAGIDAPDRPFFVNPQGKSFSRVAVYMRFRKVLSLAGIPFKGDKDGPRIHDIRHTACVHAFANLAAAGRDMYCSLPMLSVFMGHKTVSETEYYLWLTAEMYPELASRDHVVTAAIGDAIRQSIKDIQDNGTI